jgi:Domain of unknown function (DUF397)
MSDEAVSGWRVATYTGGQGNCVEVGRSATTVAVRDTKDKEGGPVLCFPLLRGGCSRSISRASPHRRTDPCPEQLPDRVFVCMPIGVR